MIINIKLILRIIIQTLEGANVIKYLISEQTGDSAIVISV